MTWTAPDVTRAAKPYVADERTMLDAWLDFHRETLLFKCAGLTADQLKLRTTEPSPLSLLGLVRHMAEVERVWFRRRFAGMDIGPLYDTEDNPDGDFHDVDGADAEADFATFGNEVELARQTVADRSLDECFRHPVRDLDISLRWIYVHMIEEYARHNGHADLIRERIDGVTGA
ncbi:MAG TPA: DinB family protein [Micromonosporaceae bacterium]|nr:DinB family protein [Micromonosporaceae bacterium]